MTKEFSVKEIKGTMVVLEGKDVEQIDVGDFLVFKSKEFLSPTETQSFLNAVGELHPTRKVILLPSFIEACKFEESNG